MCDFTATTVKKMELKCMAIGERNANDGGEEKDEYEDEVN